ncbi:hypothetical protein I3760_15G019200 [Carya illinoinensis]|nr:hypothetical protein I3760_15G019200 [Carya illinoinensis]
MKKKYHSSLMFLTLFLICQIILCHNMSMVRAQLDATTNKQALLSFKSPRVRYLLLNGHGFIGIIPPQLSNLVSLQILDLSENSHFGHIPLEFSQLANLQILDLVVNFINGTIPLELGNLLRLKKLDLSRNNLSGAIPTMFAELGHLRNLLVLQLSMNQLTGEIPFSICNMLTGKLPSNIGHDLPHSLTELYLANNMLEEVIDLSINRFSGSLPLLGNLKNLTLLNLGYNRLSSMTELNIQAFGSLTNCTKMELLNVESSQLEGELPLFFFIGENFFTGGFPQENNYFQGEIPSSIGKLKRLQKIPDIFRNLTQLYFLDMSDNQLSGGFPSSLAYCQHLSFLYLPGNKLTGSITKHITEFSSLRELLLARNLFTGSLSMEIGNLKQLEVLDISGNLLSGNIPTEITKCSSLLNLSMVRNNLTIPSSLGELTPLESLDLSSNELSGPIPKELENLEVLKTLNLYFNQLEGQIPRNGVFVNLTRNSLQGKYKLCGFNQEAAEKLRVNICTSNSHLLPKILIPVSCFLALRATNGFVVENLIGKGGFGTVYKTVFENTGKLGVNTISAVKVFDLGQSKTSKSFDAECEVLRNIRHRNLVKVFTYCSSIDHIGADFKALIMEFMSNGNLDNWLYPEDIESGLFLTLTQRLNIAIDIASALDYLHHHCEPPIVHCDLKPGNVLLDENMVAHVGDFGLARFLLQNPQQNVISTIGLKGSIGYIAPEYGQGGKTSTSGDVYSFGILLLEMFIAKKPIDEMFKQGLNLNKYASTILQEKKITDIANPRLFKDNKNYITRSSNTSTKCAVAAIRLGLSCAAHSAKDRLTMGEALIKLQELIKILVG